MTIEPQDLPELMSKAEVALQFKRTTSAIDKLRARDPQFPKPLKSGPSIRSRSFFVRAEVASYLADKLAKREVAA